MIFFTSDQHYGHANIVGYCDRPFSSVHEMDERMVELHNATVGDGDDVWHVGDFTLRPRGLEGLLPRLRGRHRLVMGNHDRCHPCRGDGAADWAQRYRAAGFLELHERVWLDLPEPMGRTLLCHMPMRGPAIRPDDRLAAWKPTQEELSGRPLIHGHVHERWRVRGSMLNVGVDVWGFRPVSLGELVEAWRADRAS